MVAQVAWKAHNPLRCTATEMAPNLLLMSKLIVLTFFCWKYILYFNEPYLPFVPFFDLLNPKVLWYVLEGTMGVGDPWSYLQY